MEKSLALLCNVLFLTAGITAGLETANAQALGQLEKMAGTTVVVPEVNGPSPVSSSVTSSGSSSSILKSSSTSLSTVVAGALLQGVLNSLLSSPAEKSPEQLEAEKKEQERIAEEEKLKKEMEEKHQQEVYDNLMKSSKDVPGTETLDFKNLDGNMETLRKDASDPFDSGSKGGQLKKDSAVIGKPVASPDLKNSNGTNPGQTAANSPAKGTAFFGVPVSSPEFQTVVEPESAPVYKDIKTSVNLTDQYLKNEKLVVGIIAQAINNNGSPIIEKPDCKTLNEKLTRYRSDLVRFQEWNKETLDELGKWKKQNDDAFWNAVTDGASAAFGVFLDYLKETRASALQIKKLLEDNEAKYLKDKVFTATDIERYKKLLDQRINLCNITEFSKSAMEPWDYVNFAKNLLQGTTEKLTKSDGDCQGMINTLKDQGILSETPWVDAGQFAAEGIINKFLHNPNLIIGPNSVLKNSLKIPYVTIAELAVNEAYNVTDMWKSYQNICTLRDAD
ncbi:MAG: hypothetical protein Q8907_15030, partial [Bacteroidota bacterium]|nr:hypothetical protein [Bacteroidota bacterium]